MPGKPSSKLAGLISSVSGHIQKKTRSKKTGAAMADFARRLYSNVPPDDLRGITPETLAGAAASLWEQMADRQPGKAKVRVFTPRADSHGWAIGGHTIAEIINDDMPFLVDSLTSAAEPRKASARCMASSSTRSFWASRTGPRENSRPADQASPDAAPGGGQRIRSFRYPDRSSLARQRRWRGWLADVTCRMSWAKSARR